MVRSEKLIGRPMDSPRRDAFRVVVALVLLLGGAAASCRHREVRPGAVPKVRALVITIRTTIQPGGKISRHELIYANGRIRLGNEVDQRRLLNIPENSVTFIDDVARTFRNATYLQMLEERNRLMQRPPPTRVPAAELIDARVESPIGRFQARRILIRLGGYQREIWLSRQPLPVENFLPLFVVSEPISPPYASLMRAVHQQLLGLRGFPVLDTSTMTYDKHELKIEKAVERVEEKDVPLALITIPPGYRDLTPPPPTESSAGRPPASSAPRGRKAPAAE